MTADTNPSDEELVRRCKSGDGDALRILFDRYEDLLRARIQRWIPNHLRRRFSVSDVLQETRLVALERFADFEEGAGSFKRWLAGIAEMKARRAVQWHTAAKRDAHREVTRGQRPDTAQFPANQTSPSQAAMAAEQRELVQKTMQALPADYRRVLQLVREEGLTTREAAVHLGRSYEATKKLYGRALARITEEFERLRGEDHG